uniref:Small ribosomal subunit protein uS19c n=1 Tax=prasinophyte sp. MBIC10622 TaxID=156113 RepID=A0A650AKG5_9CHLO|nr:ribosomal protein S19 [prasinophyte sp. MBIC10622]
MARSVWKGPFVDASLLRVLSTDSQEEHYTYSRRSVVLPQFVGTVVHVHNGKSHTPVRVSEDMIGHKFGEFASTRRRAIHKRKGGKKK